jgi:WD40 repeat protein
MISSTLRLLVVCGILVLAATSVHAGDRDKPRLDPYGDSLPAEALQRLGPSRFRSTGSYGDTVLSSDGKTVFVDLHQSVAIFDATSGKEIKWCPAENTHGPVAVSPDGTKFGVATYNTGFYEVYDVKSGKVSGRLEANVCGRQGVSFSQDGKRVAVSHDTGGKEPAQVTTWDTSRFTKLHTIVIEEESSVHVALSGDGKTLATWDGRKDEEHIVTLWEAETGKQLRYLAAETEGIRAVVFSPDGKELAILEREAVLSLWNTESGKSRHRVAVRRDTASVLCYSDDGKQLAAGTYSGAIQIWETSTAKSLSVTPGPNCAVEALVYQPDKQFRAVGQEGLALRLWEAPSGRVLSVAEGHTMEVTTLSFSPDSKTVFSGAEDGVRVWEAATGKCLRYLSLGASDSVEPKLRRHNGYRFTLSPDGQHALRGSEYDQSLHVMNLASGAEETALELEQGDGLHVSVEFSPDGKLLVVVGERRRDGVRLWSTATGRQVGSLKIVGGSGIQAAVLPDGKAVVTTEDVRSEEKKSGTIRFTLWDIATGKIRWTQRRLGGWLEALTVSPTGEFFAAMTDRGLGLYDAEVGTEWGVFPIGEKQRVDLLRFSPDGRTLALAGDEGKVILWEVATGKKRGEFVEHRGGISALAFSPDGRVLAAACGDSTVLLWDLTGQFNATVQAQGKPQAQDSDTLWKEVADAEPEKAHRLIQRLTNYPAEATALMKAKLSPAKEGRIDAGKIDKFIADLDHDDFDRREQASEALRELGKSASAALTNAVQATHSAEKKRRLTELLDALKVKGPRPEMVRPTRALELLERIATPEAKQVLQELAKGDPDAPLTQDAKATLKRLTAQGN